MQVAAVAALSGLQQAQARVDTVARRIAGANPSDAVDLSTEAVSLIEARNDFAANISVLKTADQIEKSLLNLLA